MARYYHQGQIVGEADPPKTLPEIAKWCQDEYELAGARLRTERNLHTQVYLMGRRGALNKMLIMLEALS